MNNEFYAFWKHDIFPGFLGGTVTNMRSDGMIETVGYGKGSWFKPCKIVPVEEGRKIAAELATLKQEHLNAQAKLRKEFIDKRNQIITL
jgi:predicted DNA-binding antitoxin AbrB/MazE fold protein